MAQLCCPHYQCWWVLGPAATLTTPLHSLNYISLTDLYTFAFDFLGSKFLDVSELQGLLQAADLFLDFLCFF